jgi:hypothetical protein
MLEWTWVAVGGLTLVILVLLLMRPKKQKRQMGPVARHGDRDDGYAEAAASASTSWKRKLEEVQRDHEGAMQSMQHKARRAQELVSSSGVADAVCELFLMARRWHKDWLRRERRGSIVPPQLTLPPEFSEFSIDESGNGMNWTERRVRFRLDYDKGYNRLKLSVNGSEVLCFDCVGDPGIGNLRPGDVRAFQAGSWMTQVNETAGEIRIADLKTLHAQEFDVSDRRAGNLNF